MKTTRGLTLAAALVGLSMPLTSQALEFTGYMRAGAGDSSGSDSQSCFQLPGAPAKYRLGNECQNRNRYCNAFKTALNVPAPSPLI